MTDISIIFLLVIIPLTIVNISVLRAPKAHTENEYLFSMVLLIITMGWLIGHNLVVGLFFSALALYSLRS